MTGFNSIYEFDTYLRENQVHHLTVIEYRARGGVWKQQRGRIFRHPEFGGGYLTTVRFRLHEDLEDHFGSAVDVFLACDYHERLAFEVSEDGTRGTLHGFTTDRGYKVDIVAHARTQ